MITINLAVTVYFDRIWEGGAMYERVDNSH